MDIKEMHVVFRQYAQQMGLQQVRAILPEQIDILLNTSISDTVNELLRETVGIVNDRIITESTRLNKINALRTLYRVDTISLMDSNNPSFEYKKKDYLTGKYTSKDEYFKKYSNLVMFWVDFSINYTSATKGWSFGADGVPSFPVKNITDEYDTNMYPVRIIDDIFITDTLNDFVLKNRLRSPILTIYDSASNIGIIPKIELYIDRFDKATGLLENNLIPYEFRMSYVKKPAKVKYAEDLNGDNVDCDLPEHLHVDIIKHAVDLYRVAVSGSLYAQQQSSNNAAANN